MSQPSVQEISMAAALDTPDEMENPKKFAKESVKTQKTREKLKKQLDDIERKITADALKETSQEIHRWIARHAHTRVTLKNKNICLFDENQNAAKLSNKVSTIAQRLKEDTGAFPNLFELRKK